MTRGRALRLGLEGAAGLGRAAAPESAQRYKRRHSYSKNGSCRRKIRQDDDLCHNRREKVRPAQGLHGLTREKLRPARPLQRSFREKTRPARHKTPILGHFSCAGRTFSRSHPPSDRAGRTFSRTEHSHVPTLKPITPPQPLMQASMKPSAPMLAPKQRPLKPPSPLRPRMQANVKPPAPLLAPKQRPLKPATPLQPKNAQKTASFRPQRRCRFQLGLGLREQRRWRFQPHAQTSEQRRQGFHARDFQCPRAIAGPGRASRRRTEPYISAPAPLV